MKRKTALLLTVILLACTIMRPAAAAGDKTAVSLRIEGLRENLFYNDSFSVNYAGAPTMRDVVSSYNSVADVPKITVAGENDNAHIEEIGGLKERSLGSPYADGWMIRINNKIAALGLDRINISAGDDIVIYFADAALIQYPEIDLTRLLTDGIVKFTSMDTAIDASGNVLTVKNAVAGATVDWDGMVYTTDTNGEIIIDSTGAGVRHTVQIDRAYDNGLPSVLRFAPGYYVKYGYHDVSKDDWYYSAVMSVSDKQLMSGVTETDFAPNADVNRAMFVTILGRLANADADQTVDTGFSDVINDGWSAGYILWAAQNGVAAGNTDGTFDQYGIITREQLIAMLYRFAVMNGFDTDTQDQALSACTDIGAISPYAETAMKWAAAKGIVSASGGLLNPKGQATRGQTAVMLDRFLKQFYV